MKHPNKHTSSLQWTLMYACVWILSCSFCNTHMRKCNLVVNLQRKPFNYCSHGKVVCNSVVMDCHPLSGSLAYENVKDFKVIWRTFEHIHAAKLHIPFSILYFPLPSINLQCFDVNSTIFIGVVLWYETNFKGLFLS